MSVLIRIWKWLSDSKIQKTLAFLGSGLTVVAVATWQVYVHFSEPKPSGKGSENISASQGGIAVAGNVAATASPGGTAVIATGNVTIGITLEQHEQSLRRREQEIRQEIAQSSAAEKQKIALLEKELADAQLKLQNPASDLDNYKTKLAEASKTLDKFKQVFAASELDQARQALAEGNTSAAELLLAKVLTAGKDGAAEAAYQLGILAESRIRYGEASRYYHQAAKLDPDNAQYLFAAGRIRVDLFRDRFRRTGNFRPQLSELQQGEKGLEASYRVFTTRGDLASAAQSLIILGDSRRMQNQWSPAIEYYRRAETLANQARQPAHQAKALMGRARAEMLGLRDSKSAALHLEEAVRLSTAVEDKTYLFDALNFMAENQIRQGELILALETLNRAFSVATGFKDQSRLFYGYLDRADVYLKLSDKSADQKKFDICYETLDLATADYREALALAKIFGWEGLAKSTEAFLLEVDARRWRVKALEALDHRPPK